MPAVVSLSQHDWSLHRKGPIDQLRHNEKVKEAIKENLPAIIGEESIIATDGAKIVKQMGGRANKAIVALLETAHEPLTTDPRLIASVLQGAMVGISRRMLESNSPDKQFESFRRELIVLACAYLNASSVPLPD